MFAFGAVTVELHMRQMQRHASRGLDCRESGRDIAWNAEIVGVQMQRMRDLELRQRLLQSLDDSSRGHAIEGHDIVEPKGPRIIFEGFSSAGVDAFEAEAVVRRQGSRRRNRQSPPGFRRRAADSEENHRCREWSAWLCR